MDVPCLFCNALHWIGEKLASSSNRNPKFGLCCDSGKVRLPLLQQPPPPLLQLFIEDSTIAKRFRQDIWKYNRTFAFTSMSANEDYSINSG